MTLGSRLAAAISDRANPVVVKELRQAVQSRLVIAILLLFLLVNVLIVSGFLVLSDNVARSEQAGQELFAALFVVLVLTCMVFVPLYAAVRLTMERNDSNIDLLFITTIAPAAIIRGKFFSAVALMALIYSASTPFLTFTYLLRGIDLPSIFFALGAAFLWTALAIMLAIFVGSLSGGLLLRIILFIGLLYAGFGAIVLILGLGLGVARMGLASRFVGHEAWAMFGFFMLLGLAGWGLLYLLSVAAVSARSSNRMFPARVFLTVCWLTFGVIAGSFAWANTSSEPVMIWVVASLVALSLILAVILAERESWTPRVRRHIPRSGPLRLLAWLFYTGSAGGVLWCCVLSFATLLVGFAVAVNAVNSLGFTMPRDALEAPRVMFGVFLFTWCYGLSGVFLRRMILPKSVPLLSTTLGMLLLTVFAAVPLLLAYTFHGPNWQIGSLPVIYLLANPFVLERTGYNDQVAVYTFLGVWASLALLVNLPWFFGQWRAFKRHEAKPVLSLAPAAEEPPVVHV